MAKKLIGMVLLICMVLTVLAGCSGPEQEPSGTVAEKPSESSSEGTSTKTQEGPTHLTLWHTYTSATENKPFEDTIYSYEKVNPNVKLECVAYSTADIISNITVAVMAHTMPDFAVLDNPKYAALVEAGVYAPLTEWFYNWEESKYYKKNCLDMGTINGELYGILYDPCGLALWCNAELLRKAGYDQPPETLEEFIEVALACTDPANGVYGFATSTRKEEQGSVFQHGAFLLSAGGSIYDLNSEAGLAWANMVHTLYSNKAISQESLNWTQGDAFNQWLAGNAAMCLSGDWNIKTFLNPEHNTKNIEVMMGEIPTYGGHTSSGYFGGEMIGITNDCKELEAAYDFLEYWLSKESVAAVNLAISKNSPRTDLTNKEIFASLDPKALEMKSFYDRIIETAVPRGPDAAWMDLSDVFIECMQSIAIGDAKPEEAIAKAAEAIDKLKK